MYRNNLKVFFLRFGGIGQTSSCLKIITNAFTVIVFLETRQKNFLREVLFTALYLTLMCKTTVDKLRSTVCTVKNKVIPPPKKKNFQVLFLSSIFPAIFTNFPGLILSYAA
jgi:hypothetical protein